MPTPHIDFLYKIHVWRRLFGSTGPTWKDKDLLFDPHRFRSGALILYMYFIHYLDTDKCNLKT
jgi:hypothetical protein